VPEIYGRLGIVREVGLIIKSLQTITFGPERKIAAVARSRRARDNKNPLQISDYGASRT
jgi:hypothetical protein